MILRISVAFGVATFAVCAQSPMVKRGSEVFGKTCAVAYCHGPEGSAGRGPKLAGRAFSAAELSGLILYGRAGTAMPGFEKLLKTEDVEAVTQYVLSLSDAAAAVVTSSSPTATARRPAPAEKGRGLFLDAVRMGGCGRCHELEDRGTPVGPDLRTVDAARFHKLQAVSPSRAVTAIPTGESAFPALVVEQTTDSVRMYDLSSPLPVLRTFRPAEVRLNPGTTWSHVTAIADYTEAELNSVGEYLEWVKQNSTPK